jgi:competence protein ComEA
MAVIILIAVALMLIGWRWIGDRTGTRPTELQHDSAAVAHRVDINKATRNELMQLPGIGPGRADKILNYRKTKGGFQRVEELRGVEGIGEATMARIKPLLSVESESNEAADAEPERLSRKPAAPVSESAKASGKKPAPDGAVDLNRANAAELQRLPGIGPALAQRIIDERERKPFAKIEELRRVSGIGAKRLEQIRPFVVVLN